MVVTILNNLIRVVYKTIKPRSLFYKLSDMLSKMTGLTNELITTAPEARIQLIKDNFERDKKIHQVYDDELKCLVYRLVKPVVPTDYLSNEYYYDYIEKTNGLVVNEGGKCGLTLLACAAVLCDIPLAEWLLSQGANIHNGRNNCDVLNCMLESEQLDPDTSKQLDMVKFLMSRGAALRMVAYYGPRSAIYNAEKHAVKLDPSVLPYLQSLEEAPTNPRDIAVKAARDEWQAKKKASAVLVDSIRDAVSQLNKLSTRSDGSVCYGGEAIAELMSAIGRCKVQV
jgi:hypothetical protein